MKRVLTCRGEKVDKYRPQDFISLMNETPDTELIYLKNSQQDAHYPLTKETIGVWLHKGANIVYLFNEFTDSPKRNSPSQVVNIILAGDSEIILDGLEKLTTREVPPPEHPSK